MEKQSNIKKSSWTKGKCLGKGSFGTVSLAINESDGAIFAVKSVGLATCLPNQLECLENEIRIIRSLSSPYVVEYLGDDVTGCESTASCYRNLHVEYMPGGTVADMALIKRRLDDVDEKILRWHTRCLVSALKYVHGEGIVHCDVKGRNVLVGHDLASVKLADFGSAVQIGNQSTGDNCRSLITPRGSPLWMAPEVIRGEYQGPESDVWSVGCTVIEMVTGKSAWEERGLSALTQIAYSEELPELPAQLSELGKDFVLKCLERDPNQRWSCDQLLQHPFIASASPPSTIRESSPRCVLSFASCSDSEEDENTENFESSARERIGKLATEGRAIWESDGWVTVRSYALNFTEWRSTEYPESMRTEKEIEGFGGSDSVEWQSGDYEGAKGLKSSSGGCRCEWSTGSSCRYGNGTQTVEKEECAIYRFCNLLSLLLCNLKIFKYILIVFLNSIYFYGVSHNLISR